MNLLSPLSNKINMIDECPFLQVDGDNLRLNPSLFFSILMFSP